MLTAALLGLGPAAASAQSSAPGGLSEIFQQGLRLAALWACGGWILWLVAFMLVGRLLGLEVGLLKALGVSLLGGLMTILPAILITALLQSQVSGNALGLIVQTVSFAALALAAKLVLKTDFARALLMVLLVTVAVSATIGLLVIMMFR